MDKLKVTSHIKDDDLKIKMYKLVDICNSVSNSYSLRNTEFLNPYEIRNAISIINYDKDLEYTIEGGYEDAERAVIFIYPYYYILEEGDLSLTYLEVRGNFKFTTVSHRDYLGSLMSLGIKREKIGDILVHDDYCQMVVDSDIADFIIYNYNRIKNNKVSVTEIDKSDLKPPIKSYDDKVFSISSLRLDSVIAGAFNLSRQEASKLINADLVQVNYEPVNNVSRSIEEGSIISVRKKGKFIFDKVLGMSKKDKFRVKINKFV